MSRFAGFGRFGAFVEEIFGMFEAADRPAMEAALAAGDFPALCAACHKSEAEMIDLMRRAGEAAAEAGITA